MRIEKPTLLSDLSQITRLGWLVSVSYGSSGYLVQAKRVAVGGRLVRTEYDNEGLMLVGAELPDVLAQLITVLNEAMEHGRAMAAAVEDRDPILSSDRDMRALEAR